MASALATGVEEPHELRLLREADGAALLGNYVTACPEGHDPPHLQHPKLGINLADYHGSADSSGPDARNRVHQEAREVHTSFRTSGLRCSGSEGSHLRSVRHEVCPQQGGPTNTGNTKGISNSTNPLERPRQCPQRDPRQTRGIQRGNGQRGSKRSIPKILAALLNLLAGICAPATTTTSAYLDGNLIENTNFAAESSGEDSPKASGSACEAIHTASEAVAWERQRQDEYGHGSVSFGHGLDRGPAGSTGGVRHVPVRDARGAPMGAQLGPAGGIGGVPLRSERPGARLLGGRGGVLDQLRGSADRPLDAEDRGAFVPKVGLMKRVRGNQTALSKLWEAEKEVYLSRAEAARETRIFKADVIEVYAGSDEITRLALRAGLRALQPAFGVDGLDPDDANSANLLRSMLRRRKPYLLVYDLDGPLVYNRLDQVLEEMIVTILTMQKNYGAHFLVKGTLAGAVWQHPRLRLLRKQPGTEFKAGHMCRFGLRDTANQLVKGAFGWLSDLPTLLSYLSLQCVDGKPHVHGEGSGNPGTGHFLLTQAIVQGAIASLKDAGDERFVWGQDRFAWTSSTHGETYEWHPPGEEEVDYTIYYLDVNRHESSWMPLLQEAEEQLRSKVRLDKVIPLNTPYGEQLKALVPWTLHRIQICRTPAQRRLPLEVLQAGTSHRGAVLWLSDGSVSIETELVDQVITQSANRFSSPVRIAIFFFGIAPASSLNETDNAQPEAAKVRTDNQEIEDTDLLRPHQPGFRDITFPGLSGAPKWLLQVMRRLHTNLGHPSTATMVRQLTASGASEAAIQAARHLRCEVCLRVQPPREPRPAKAFTPRRFNDRLNLDVLWLKDIRGHVHGYLSQVDDATCYHVLNYISNRSEEEVMKLLVNGWFSFFGAPDEMLLDADGCFRGYRFETLQAQCSVKVRYAPADAHYQMGRAERHGQAVRYMVQRLVSQFAPVGHAELNILVMMAAAAKNSLIRRAGASPAQWVFGRNPKLPGSLLSPGGDIESCQLHSDSEKLRHVEQVRTQAMMLFHQFESDNSLRTALLRKPRPARGPFVEGQRVAYFRQKNALDGEGTAEGYRQGVIVAVDGSSLWIRNNRGRLISASKEQVRQVFGEEEWWTPSVEDLRLLKNSDQDLATKHAAAPHPPAAPDVGPTPGVAFRLPAADVPDEFSDSAAEAALRARLQPLPALDGAGQPLQDASGQPLTASTPSPMLAPLMLIPSTPKAVPATPRARARSRSKTPTPSRRTSLVPVPETSALAAPLPAPRMSSLSEPQAQPSEQRSSPSEPRAQPSEQRSSPSEPRAQPSEQRSSPSEPQSQRPGQEVALYENMPQASGPPGIAPLPQASGPSSLTSRQVSQESSGHRRSSQGTSGLERDLESLMDKMTSQGSSRGVKRPGDPLPVDVVAPAARSTTQEPLVNEPNQQVFLTFCRDCGEQHRVLLDGVSTCSRCSSTYVVDSPMHVRSWFDEVKEREALEQHFEDRDDLKGQPPLEQSVPRASDLPREFTVSSSTAKAVEDYGIGNPLDHQRTLRRLDVLHRHGRAEAKLVGWDGSPSELQPFFENYNYLTVAHYFGDHTTPEPTDSFGSLVSAVSSPDVAETLSKKLLAQRDFRPETLHQLMGAVTWPRSHRECLEGQGCGFLLGLYSHGNFSGLSNRTFANKHLVSYLAQYFRHHGMRGDVTSFYLSKNSRARCHRDVNNMKGTPSWTTSVGDYTGGRLWIECRTKKPPGDAVYRSVKGKRVPGVLVNTRDEVQAFPADHYHEVEPFKGERYSLVAYTSRSFDFASQGLRRKLRKLGLLQASTPSTSWQTLVDQWPLERPDWLDSPVCEAYPVRSWKPPADGETMAMDTSGEEGDDANAPEPPSRAQRQALKKELPWQAMSESEIPQFVQAVLEEWSEWKKWSSCRPVYVDVNQIDPSLILKSRVCFRWKPRGDGTFKPKARIVIAGYRDPHLPLLSRDSPVLSRAGLQCILQWATSLKVPLWTGDCKSAFLQGTAATERPTSIFMRPPSDPVSQRAVDEWSHRELLYKLSAPVYGQANAPRRWYLHVHQVLSKLGWETHTLDPCLWLKKEIIAGKKAVVAVLGVHVDDMILACHDGHDAYLNEVHSSFTWGGDWQSKDFTFVGRHICQHEDWSLTVDQASYVSEVPITKVKYDPEAKLSAHPELITEFRSGIGSLQWLAGTSRGDISADVSLLQKPPSELKVEDLLEVNSVLRYVRATNSAYYKMVPIDFKDLILIAYGDSGWANAPGGKSQGGLVIAATHRSALTKPQAASLMEWKSFRHQRVLRSTLAAEAASLDRAEDYGNFLATMLSELIDGQFSSTLREVPLVEVVPVTDARSLWDAIHRLSTNFQEKRVEISIASLRQQCRGLRWVPTEVQVADGLTKRSRALRDRFRVWMGNPWITLVDSRSPEDILEPSRTNAAWR